MQALIFLITPVHSSNMPFTQAFTLLHPDLSFSANQFFIKCVRLYDFT